MLEKLRALGADIDDGLSRFMNNAALYERCLKKYPAQAKKCTMLEEIKNKDWENAAKSAHAMKGVSSNLSLTPLYELYSDIVTRLRNDDTDGIEEVAQKCAELEAKFHEVILQ